MATPAGERIFLRRASGLIKSASTTDVFIFDIGLVSIGLGVGLMLYFGPAFYFGGNLYVGTILAGVALLGICAGMICWSLTIPRSGGIYVFGSRSLWPPLAFTLSFVEASALAFYSAFGAYYITQLGVAPMISTVGIITGDSGVESFGADLAGKWPTFGIGAGCLIVGAIILASGMRRFFVSQKIMFTIAVVGLLIFFGTLLATSREEFASSFNTLLGPQLGLGPDAYNGVIQVAAEGGWMNPGYDWKQTILVANWAFLPLLGAALSIAIGGEIKQVNRGQTFGILGALIGSVILFVITFALAYRTFGYDFLGSVAYSGVTPVAPYVTLLGGIGSGSVTLTVLIAVGFIAWIWLWVPTQVLYPTRAITAWSLDRVFPDFFGRVSERTHTPIPAIGLGLVWALSFLAVLTFSTYFTTVIFLELIVASWAIVLLAGVFFPYRRPDIFEKSPIAGIKIRGVPLMSVMCAIGFVCAALFFCDLFYDGIAGGHRQNSNIILASWFGGAFILYWILWYWRRRQGVKVELAFKEIPVE
jgi:APA family basic amino acid/polyamine antiporter